MELKTLRQKVKGLTDGGEDRGVSPVIGVILMVAITVILAAVIGAFVLGLGDDLESSSAPTLSASTSVSDDWGEATAGQGTAFIIAHSTGNSMDMTDTRIVVRSDDGASVATLDSDAGWSVGTTGTDEISLKLNGEADATTIDGMEFGSGDTITVDDVDGTLTAGDDYTIQIIHTPSGSTVSESTVTLN